MPSPRSLNTNAPLWQQLQLSAQALMQVMQGRSSRDVLESIPNSERAGVQALLFASLRNYGRASAIRKLLAPRKPASAADSLLCCALALIGNADESYDNHTLVNQAVEAAKRQHSTRNQAGLINACLRRYLREQVQIEAKLAGDATVAWNHPAWWIEKLQQQQPQHWQAMLEHNKHFAPMHLRVNAAHTTAETAQTALQAQGISTRRLGEFALALESAIAVGAINGFETGLYSVQDAGAQQAAPQLLRALKPALGKIRILDACAAPGGKTTHLAELADAMGLQAAILALEIDESRCTRMAENIARSAAKTKVEIKVADAAQLKSWWDGAPFDAILLDAPCSASGIVRRHPDIRWLRRSTDIAALAKLQAALLQNLWSTLKTGGVLLYCTCSVFDEEGENQVRLFMKNNSDAQRLPSLGQIHPAIASAGVHMTDNYPQDNDGFYYALLEKR